MSLFIEQLDKLSSSIDAYLSETVFIQQLLHKSK